jgi:hypothetical protein
MTIALERLAKKVEKNSKFKIQTKSQPTWVAKDSLCLQTTAGILLTPEQN